MIHALVDPSLLQELHGIGGTEFVSELITQFESDARERIDLLITAAQNTDHETLRSAAHAIKGSSASVGAVKMKQLSGEIEAGASSMQADELIALVKALQQALTETMAILVSMQ